MAMKGADDRIADASSSRRGTPLQVLRALLLGCAVAAVFGSGPMVAWSKDLPDGPLTERLQDAAVRWAQAVSRFDAAWPYEWLHGLVRGVRAEG
jgi:hypothetical protein